MPYGIDYKRIKTLIGNMFAVKPVRAVLQHYLFMSLFEFFYLKSCLELGIFPFLSAFPPCRCPARLSGSYSVHSDVRKEGT